MCEVPAFVARPKFGHLAPKPATTRIYFYTTPIVPVVRGPVIEVPVQPNKPLKKGDVLFRIDPNSYEYALQQKRATLAEAEQTVKQLLAAAEAAQANVNEEIASRDRAKKSFARYQAGNHLPGGAVARVAVYTDHWHEFALLRKILLRMKSWENYIFLEGR